MSWTKNGAWRPHVSAWQQCVYEGPRECTANQLKEHNVENTFSGFRRCRRQYGCIFISLAVDASEICEMPRNSPKNRTYISSRSSKVINLGVNRKLICNFLLVFNSNYGRISYHFRDIDAFSSKIVFPPLPCLTPPSRGTPCDNNIYRW